MINKPVWSFCKSSSYIPPWKTHLYDLINPILFRTYKLIVIVGILFYCLWESQGFRFREANTQKQAKAWKLLGKYWWSGATHELLAYTTAENSNVLGSGAQIIPRLQTWRSANSYVMFSAKYVIWMELCYWNFAACVKYFQKPFRKRSCIIWSCPKYLWKC